MTIGHERDDRRDYLRRCPPAMTARWCHPERRCTDIIDRSALARERPVLGGSRASRSSAPSGSGWSWQALRVARRQLRRADVRDHRGLPPLLLAPHVQDQPRVPVHPRAARAWRRRSRARCGGPRITATTTSTPTSPRTSTRRVQRGFWWSHIGWILVARHKATDYDAHQGLRELPRAAVPRPPRSRASPVALGLRPLLHRRLDRRCSGATSCRSCSCWHITFCINSLAHVWGRRRYATTRRLAQQPAARAPHARRGLAQQPPPLPALARARASTGGRSTSATTCSRRSSSLRHRVGREGVPRHVRDQRGRAGARARRGYCSVAVLCVHVVG